MTWIIIGIGLPLVLVVLWFARWFNHEEDMGSVSGQWLAEHRQNHES